MSTAAIQGDGDAEVAARDKLPRCRIGQIYGTKDTRPGYWGVLRRPIHDDEQGAEAVIVALGARLVFRADAQRPDWFVVQHLQPKE